MLLLHPITSHERDTEAASAAAWAFHWTVYFPHTKDKPRTLARQVRVSEKFSRENCVNQNAPEVLFVLPSPRYSSSFLPPTEGLWDYPLIQSNTPPPAEFNKQTDFNSDKPNKKLRTSIQATFSYFPSPAGRHPKGPVYAPRHDRGAASKELSAPLTFTHPFLIVLQCGFWGEGSRECHHFSFLNECTVWPGLERHYHRVSQEAIAHMGMVEHRTTAGSQNELANILLQLLLCHLASS